MSFRSRRKPPAAAAKMTADQEREIIDQWRAERARHGSFEGELHPAVSKMVNRKDPRIGTKCDPCKGCGACFQDDQE